TPNVAETSSASPLASHARATRLRRSIEYGAIATSAVRSTMAAVLRTSQKRANDPDRLARFKREAQLLASLNHPNIAHIYGVGERVLVMELDTGHCGWGRG